MKYNIIRDKFESTGEMLWRLEIIEHNFFDFPDDYTIIVECRTQDGLLRNIEHYTRKYISEIGKSSTIKKDRKHK